jgi:imidazolonepropionase-like amidohydrolase
MTTQKESQSSSITILAASKLFTGKPGEWISDPAVVIHDEKVVWVGKESELPLEYRAGKQERYPDATILPGFIENHAHLGTEWRKHPEPDISEPTVIA